MPRPPPPLPPPPPPWASKESDERHSTSGGASGVDHHPRWGCLAALAGILAAGCSYDYSILAGPRPDAGGPGNRDAGAGGSGKGGGSAAGGGGSAGRGMSAGAGGHAGGPGLGPTGGGAGPGGRGKTGGSEGPLGGDHQPGADGGMGGPGEPEEVPDAGTQPRDDAATDAPATGDAPRNEDTATSGPDGGTPPDPDLVIWFPFDDSSGTKARDLSISPGGPRDGTLSTTGTGGAVSFSAMAQVGTYALALTGNGNAGGGYVSLTTLEKLAPDAVTLSVWVYPTSSADWQRIFDFGNNGNDTMFLTTSQGTDASNTVRFAMTSSGVIDEQRIETTTVLALNTWHHLAVVLPTGDSYAGSLYINGALAGRNNQMSLHPADLSDTTKNYLGRSQYPLDPYFSGRIDDFRVYKRALSAPEIAALYALH